MTISQRIFDILSKKHLKQSELADFTGVKPQTISEWKSKGSNPSADKISIIADFLQISTDYLLTGKEAKQSTPTTISEEDQEILTMYNALSERKKGEIYGTLKTLSSMYNDKEVTTRGRDKAPIDDLDTAVELMDLARAEAIEFLQTKSKT